MKHPLPFGRCLIDPLIGELNDLDIARGGHYPGILEIPEFFLLIWSPKF